MKSTLIYVVTQSWIVCIDLHCPLTHLPLAEHFLSQYFVKHLGQLKLPRGDLTFKNDVSAGTSMDQVCWLFGAKLTYAWEQSRIEGGE